MTGGRGFGTECPTLCASLGLKSVVDGQSGRDKMRTGFAADLCYNIGVHLKVKGPKKPSRVAIRKDADYLRATCVGATAMKARIRLAKGQAWQGQKDQRVSPRGVTAKK